MSSTNEVEVPEIVSRDQQDFVNYYNSLDIAEEGTLRFFRRDHNDKTYYSLHGNDALYVVEHMAQTTSIINYWAGDINTGLKTVIIPQKPAEDALREALLQKQMKIEIWKPLRRRWQMSHKASPGNLEQVDELLFSNTNMSVSPVIVAVRYGNQKGQKTVGVSYADTTSKQLGVSEFVDNDLFSNLESILIQVGAKECILPNATENDPDASKILAILNRCNIVATMASKGDFNDKNIVQNLDRLLKRELSVASMPEFELKDAMSSCACIIKYLDLVRNDLNCGQFELENYDLSQYMKLSGSAIAALSLMPSIRDGSNKKNNVFGLLNQCKTAQGSRLLAQWIKQPLLNMEEIDKRHDIVQVLINSSQFRGELQYAHLKYVPDLSRLSKRFQKRIGTLQDAVRAYQFSHGLPAMFEFIRQRVPSKPKLQDLFNAIYLNPIQAAMTKFVGYEQLIENAIDLKATQRHEYMIKAEYKPELQGIHVILENILSDINKEFAKVDPDSKLKPEIHPTYGHCIRVTRQKYDKIENKGNFIQCATTKAGVFLTTSTLKRLSQSYKDTSKQYNKAQEGAIKEVMEVIATYCPTFEDIGSTIAHLDVLVSFAHASTTTPSNYIRPKLTPLGEGNVVLKEARHPCLELQDSVTFIPNDIILERDSSDFQIITGPNMGGKSTYIRQAGIIALMTQIGCFVPCKEAQLCLFDAIFARVDASDSQLKGISTFMTEMLEIASILQSATKNSLIIIDEMGRGTSNSDGFGIAYAISNHIATEIKCFCFFATHFHELTKLSNDVSHVKNLSVSFDIGEQREVTLLYKVNEGVSDESFGIQVAEMANFPPSVVELAKRKMDELEDSSRSMEVDETLDAESEALVLKLVEEVSQLADMDDEARAQVLQNIREKYIPEIEKRPYLKIILYE